MSVGAYRLFAVAIVLMYLGLAAAAACGRNWREAAIGAIFALSNAAIFLWPA